MGGISKSLYFGGMVIAHVIAIQAYKAELISKIYMVQDKSVHDSHDSKVFNYSHNENLYVQSKQAGD